MRSVRVIDGEGGREAAPDAQDPVLVPLHRVPRRARQRVPDAHARVARSGAERVRVRAEDAMEHCLRMTYRPPQRSDRSGTRVLYGYSRRAPRHSTVTLGYTVPRRGSTDWRVQFRGRTSGYSFAARKSTAEGWKGAPGRDPEQRVTERTRNRFCGVYTSWITCGRKGRFAGVAVRLMLTKFFNRFIPVDGCSGG
jgi:hypothetical protein